MSDGPLRSLADGFQSNAEYLNESVGQVDDPRAEHSLSCLPHADLNQTTNKGVHNNLNCTLTIRMAVTGCFIIA
jgi:hypothetical protein